MVTIERTLTVKRPVDEVFAYLRDVGHAPRYISGQREAHRTSTGPMSVGTTFVTTSRRFPHRVTRFEIVEYEPDRRLAWTTLSRDRTTTTWGFQPAGPHTRISFTRVIEGHGLFRLPGSLVEELANERVSRELAALTQLLALPEPAKRTYLGAKHQ